MKWHPCCSDLKKRIVTLDNNFLLSIFPEKRFDLSCLMIPRAGPSQFILSTPTQWNGERLLTLSYLSIGKGCWWCTCKFPVDPAQQELVFDIKKVQLVSQWQQTTTKMAIALYESSHKRQKRLKMKGFCQKSDFLSIHGYVASAPNSDLYLSTHYTQLSHQSDPENQERNQLRCSWFSFLFFKLAVGHLPSALGARDNHDDRSDAAVNRVLETRSTYVRIYFPPCNECKRHSWRGQLFRVLQFRNNRHHSGGDLEGWRYWKLPTWCSGVISSANFVSIVTITKSLEAGQTWIAMPFQCLGSICRSLSCSHWSADGHSSGQIFGL